MTLTLYTNPMSRGRIARWMLEEVGAPYDAVIVNYGPAMRAPDYLALNPMAKVPTLVHDSQVITECAAICLYLADVFPDANLAPPPGRRAAYYRWIAFAAGPVEHAVTNRSMKFEPGPDMRSRVGYGDYDSVIATLEHAVQQAPYLAGDSFSAADVYAGAQIGWGLQFGTIPDRPAFRAYWDRIKDRPAVVRAAALDDAAMPPKDKG